MKRKSRKNQIFWWLAVSLFLCLTELILQTLGRERRKTPFVSVCVCVGGVSLAKSGSRNSHTCIGGCQDREGTNL